MNPNYSKQALLGFLTFVEKKGLVGPQLAQNWRVASGKILEDLTPAEEADVRLIDIPTSFRKFANRNSGKFKPTTLAVYRSRAENALENFASYVDDPEHFKPLGGSPRPKVEGQDRTGSKGTRTRSNPSHQGLQTSAMPRGSIALSFPMRPEFDAQIVIPRDMTAEEARRLSAFLATLASDFQG